MRGKSWVEGCYREKYNWTLRGSLTKEKKEKKNENLSV